MWLIAAPQKKKKYAQMYPCTAKKRVLRGYWVQYWVQYWVFQALSHPFMAHQPVVRLATRLSAFRSGSQTGCFVAINRPFCGDKLGSVAIYPHWVGHPVSHPVSCPQTGSKRLKMRPTTQSDTQFRPTESLVGHRITQIV